MDIVPISVKTTEFDVTTKIQNSNTVGLDSVGDKPVSIGVQPQDIVDIQTEIETQGFVKIEFGGQSMMCNKILYKTSAEWDRDKNLMSVAGTIYIYSDRLPSPGIKIGTGRMFLYDLPFVDDYILQHVNNREIHVTKQEKEFWNNKSSTEVIDETLIFRTK